MTAVEVILVALALLYGSVFVFMVALALSARHGFDEPEDRDLPMPVANVARLRVVSRPDRPWRTP